MIVFMIVCLNHYVCLSGSIYWLPGGVLVFLALCMFLLLFGYIGNLYSLWVIVSPNEFVLGFIHVLRHTEKWGKSSPPPVTQPSHFLKNIHPLLPLYRQVFRVILFNPFLCTYPLINKCIHKMVFPLSRTLFSIAFYLLPKAFTRIL